MKTSRVAAAALGTLALVVAVPVSADAATRQVTMGTAGKQAKALQDLGSDVNDFFPHAATVHVGDKVKFVPTGVHTVEFPAKGQDPTPLAAPTGNTIAGANDAAGQPFWFNGQPEIQFTPALFAGLYGKTVSYDGKK